MRFTILFWLTLFGTLGLFHFSAVAQQVSVDTSMFVQEYPEEKYLFYLTGYERVLDELRLSDGQQSKIKVVREKVDVKHQQHKDRVRALKGNLEKSRVEALQKRFFSEISSELANIKKTLSDEQLRRMRQIALQRYFVAKKVREHGRNVGEDVVRTILEEGIAEGLQLSSMQKEMIARAYESLKLGLTKIDADDTMGHRKLLANSHEEILKVLDEEQRRIVNEVIGPPTESLHYPIGN